MYLGPFYFDKKEVFLFLSIMLVATAWYFQWTIPFFDMEKLLIMAILFLIIKGLLPAVHNENFLILALFTIFLSLYLPLFPLVLFFSISLFLFRLLRVV